MGTWTSSGVSRRVTDYPYEGPLDEKTHRISLQDRDRGNLQVYINSSSKEFPTVHHPRVIRNDYVLTC